jgi:hypothetical protein
LIPNPILKVLSTMAEHRVRCLLMGGQACVFYGAAEFSRDSDFAILAVPENLERLREAMDSLRAEVIAVPPFEIEHLRRGHAVHFRCHHPDCDGLRVDVMAKMRGVDDFDDLWERRTTLLLPEGVECDLLSVADLVKAKKTQRDKDWPMIRRLVEAHYEQFRDESTKERVRFWLGEMRSPEWLVSLARIHPEEAVALAGRRTLLSVALAGDVEATDTALKAEERIERDADREYWAPLKRELGEMRRIRG